MSYQPPAHISTNFGPCSGRSAPSPTKHLAQYQLEYRVTADMSCGQALPPYYDGVPWQIVRRINGRTLWCRPRSPHFSRPR